MAQQEQAPYSRYLTNKFTAAFVESSDRTPSQPLYTDITNRAEILYMQYEITKRGKTTGSLEKRWVRIEGDALIQINQDETEKELPSPTNVYIHRRPYECSGEWEEVDSKYQGRIEVYFEERSPITIMFRELIECNEIAMKLLAGIRERSQDRLIEKMAGIFQQSIAHAFVGKIEEAKAKQHSLPKIRQIQKAVDSAKKVLSDQRVFAKFIEDWKSKVIFKEGEMNVHMRLIQVRGIGPFKLGQVKIWGGGRVRQSFLLQFQDIVPKVCYTFEVYPLGNEHQVSLMSLDSRDDIEIEMEIGGVWCRSERFTACDLQRRVVEGRLLDLRMYSKNFSCLLRVAVEVQGVGVYPSEIESITPQHYQVITSLYSLQQRPYCHLPDIHQYHTTLLEEHRQTLAYKASFSHFRPLSHLLKLEQLITKFTQVAPFNNYLQHPHIVTAIYRHLLNKQSSRYYEVEKIMWKTPHKHVKPILVALKAFDDQNPKFNFTDSFLSLAVRMWEVAQSVGVNRWPSKWFEPTTEGVQSLTFLLCLGVIKAFPSVWLWQESVSKRALPFNSVLLHYLLRNHLSDIFTKINAIELNIEAYFGIHYVVLLSSLFHAETFNKILVMVLEQRQKQQSLYLYGIIGAFMAMLEFTNQFECAYLTAHHFIITFEQLCRAVPDPFFLFSRMKHWSQLAKQTSQSTIFQQMVSDLTEYYINQAYSADIGEISQQIYPQFSCYNLRREGDWRRLILWVDRIDLGFQCKTIKLSVYQCGGKLYEHAFGGTLGIGGLDHCLELRLLKLQQLSIIVTGGEDSYCCRLDPKEIPSNLYLHLAEPLTPTRHLAPLNNAHICLQLYIKDSTQIDILDNPIPQRLRTLLLQSSIPKQTLQFIKNYTKTARLRENNFNLLYSKLGWFGCHYLTPSQRLVSVQILGPKKGGETELQKRVYEAARYTKAVYGKTIVPVSPQDSRNIISQFIKHDVVSNVISNGKNVGFSDKGAYNSAAQLITYPLQVFPIHPGTSFVDFHYRLTKLPLIQYLTYRPKQFYLLPSFSIQVSNQHSVCTIIIADKGMPFETAFTAEQTAEIENQVAIYHKMPSQMQFNYTDEPLLYDEFLHYLRLNILKQVVQREGQKRGKIRRWANSLVSPNSSIPNYELYFFYQLMNQTKYTLHLEFKETKPLPIHLHYRDYGCIFGRWVKVACLAVVKCKQDNYLYVLTQERRKKYLLRNQDVIIVDNSTQMMEVIEEEGESMESLSYRLTALFPF